MSCIAACVYVMITFANHDVFGKQTVSILVTANFDNTVESTLNMSLFCCFALTALVSH